MLQEILKTENVEEIVYGFHSFNLGDNYETIVGQGTASSIIMSIDWNKAIITIEDISSDNPVQLYAGDFIMPQCVIHETEFALRLELLQECDVKELFIILNYEKILEFVLYVVDDFKTNLPLVNLPRDFVEWYKFTKFDYRYVRKLKGFQFNLNLVELQYIDNKIKAGTIGKEFEGDMKVLASRLVRLKNQASYLQKLSPD